MSKLIEAMARALYERNPRYDQETDLDGRPTTAPYRITWDDLIEHDSGHREDIVEDALAVLRALKEHGSSERMLEAGVTVWLGKGAVPDPEWRKYLTATLRAMLTAVIEESDNAD